MGVRATIGAEWCRVCASPMTSYARASAGQVLVRCPACDHVQSLTPLWGDDAALQRAHFGEAFASDRRVWTRIVERANASRVVRRIRPAVSSGRCLEVGPGTGALLNRLRAAGYRVEALDISEHVASAIRATYGVEVEVGTLEHARNQRSQHFDVVIMRHVLEHMPDPATALASARALLRPGGIVYLAVPNIAALEASLPGWTGYQPYHLHYFNARSLSTLLRRAGFDELLIRTREPFSGWPNALVNSIRGRTRDGSICPPAAASLRGGIGYHTYNVIRMLVGSTIWPLRVIQAAAGRGEELEILAFAP